MNIIITVKAKKDNLFLGYERISSDGEWVYQLAGNNIWFTGTMTPEEPVNRTVEELPPMK